MTAALTVASAASMLLDERESVPLVPALLVIAALAVAKAASMLEDELEIEFELTLIALRAVSTLAED